MKIALIGSTDFPVVKAGFTLCEWMTRHMPKSTVIYTRGSKGFDLFMGEACRLMGYQVIELKGTGGADNYNRDVTLAQQVDEVHAFFSEKHVGEGGTQHVIDKALDIGKPAYSYIFDERHGVQLVGSDDGEGDPQGPAGRVDSPPEAVGAGAPKRARAGSKAEEDPRGPGNFGDLPWD